MKKIFAILMAALLACSLMSCKNDKDTATDDENKVLDEEMVFGKFTYAINGEGTYEITGFIHNEVGSVDVKIPAQIEGRDVTGIGEDAFKAVKTVTSIELPETIEYIGQFAFYDCDGISEVVIPDSVSKIGVGAFWGCDKLARVTLPKDLKVIDENTFKNCTVLANVTLPEGLLVIGDGAFWGCKSIAEITIPETVTDMGACAFYMCEKLEKATVLGEALGKDVEITNEKGKTETIEHTIGEIVFHGCAADLTITVTEGTEFAKYAEDNKYNVTVNTPAEEA